jgi:threonine/homoserine/homoserine lactone efflux protein
VFRQSFVANVLNPKVTLFFLSFLPQFVRMDAGSVAWQMTFLGLVFMLQAFVIFAAMGWFAAGLGQRLRDNQKFGDGLNTLAGLVFIGIGLKLALSA